MSYNFWPFHTLKTHQGISWALDQKVNMFLTGFWEFHNLVSQDRDIKINTSKYPLLYI